MDASTYPTLCVIRTFGHLGLLIRTLPFRNRIELRPKLNFKNFAIHGTLARQKWTLSAIITVTVVSQFS